MQAKIAEIQISMEMSERDELASALRYMLEGDASPGDLPQNQVDVLNDLLYELENMLGE